MAADDPHFDSVRAFLARARSSGAPAAAAARIVSLDEARAERVAPAPRWRLDELTGRLVELSGLGAVASLSAAASLIVEAQGRGEPAAWIARTAATFFPPDLDDAGVDLDALVVVRVLDVTAMIRAADRLLRSGAFGLVVLDLGPGGQHAEVSIAAQGRLVGLAQHHDAAVVAITEKSHDTASLGSMVSLRAEAVRERLGSGGFRVAVRAVKDKRRGPGWAEVVDVLAPPGLK